MDEFRNSKAHKIQDTLINSILLSNDFEILRNMRAFFLKIFFHDDFFRVSMREKKKKRHLESQKIHSYEYVIFSRIREIIYLAVDGLEERLTKVCIE